MERSGRNCFNQVIELSITDAGPPQLIYRPQNIKPESNHEERDKSILWVLLQDNRSRLFKIPTYERSKKERGGLKGLGRENNPVQSGSWIRKKLEQFIRNSFGLLEKREYRLDSR